MTFVAVIVYLALTFMLTVMGIEKQMIGIQVFLVGLLLTPLGAIFYIYFNKKSGSKVSYYKCHECDYIFPVKMSDCPICLEKGVKVKLTKYQSPYKVADMIGELRLA